MTSVSQLLLIFQPLSPILLYYYKQHSTTFQDGYVRSFNKFVGNERVKVNVYETSYNYMRFVIHEALL